LLIAVPQGQRLAQLAAEAASAPTPSDALRKLRELRREIDAFERRQVAHALAEGASFAAIARDLGLSRQAVHRRFRGLADEELPLLMAAEVRRILQYAREEAAALRADELAGEHILLAVMRAADLPAAAVLRTAGATLDRARTQVEGMSPRGRLFRRAVPAAESHTLLAAPAREVRVRGGTRLEVEHMLLGILDDPAGGASRTLRAIGVDPGSIRDELRRRLDPARVREG